MLFNSYTFWLFFAIVLIIYNLLPHRGQNLWLLAASYVFYGAWDWRFLGLIVVSTVIDFAASLGVAASSTKSQKRLYLLLSIVANLGILGYFKYAGFFADQLASLLTSIGFNNTLPTLHIILPVGISFYTFQTMSYTIDVYRGAIKPTRHFLDFALYVSFFPQLVAGPIERSTRLLPQVLTRRQRSRSDLWEGGYLVLLGLFKKVVIADNMAAIANTVFSTPTAQLTGWEVLAGIYAFAFQIYGDFSGYSSIARGTARWLGFDLMVNFRMPYLATSPSDFWRRWHISLSTWLRDYLYIPLGGNRHGAVKTHRNLMLTMVLGGLWHGAAWTFVVWGFFHGAILVVYRIWDKLRIKTPTNAALGIVPIAPRASRILAMVVMFHLACIGWIFFRATSVTQGLQMLGRIATEPGLSTFAIGALATVAFYVLPLFIFEAWLDRKGDIMALLAAPWVLRGLAFTYLVLMLVFFPSPSRHAFIYFQF